MIVDGIPIRFAASARLSYHSLAEADKRQAMNALRELSLGRVREGDVSERKFYRRPYAADALSLRASPRLNVLFVPRRQNGSHGVTDIVICGFESAKLSRGHYVRSHYRRNGARADRHLGALAAMSLAVRIAGSRRSHLRTEWAAIIEGSPEDGVVFSPWQRFFFAMGFLLAAVRMRLHDLARPAWRPVDWLLRASSRTNAFIASVVGAQAIYIVGDGGLPALVTEVWEPCGIAGTSLYVMARWLRRVRGVELVVPVGERPDEERRER